MTPASAGNKATIAGFSLLWDVPPSLSCLCFFHNGYLSQPRSTRHVNLDEFSFALIPLLFGSGRSLDAIDGPYALLGRLSDIHEFVRIGRARH
jgi:hypothetical protein